MGTDLVFIRCVSCQDGLAVERADVHKGRTNRGWLCSLCRRDSTAKAPAAAPAEAEN